MSLRRQEDSLVGWSSWWFLFYGGVDALPGYCSVPRRGFYARGCGATIVEDLLCRAAAGADHLAVFRRVLVHHSQRELDHAVVPDLLPDLALELVAGSGRRLRLRPCRRSGECQDSCRKQFPHVDLPWLAPCLCAQQGLPRCLGSLPHVIAPPARTGPVRPPSRPDFPLFHRPAGVAEGGRPTVGPAPNAIFWALLRAGISLAERFDDGKTWPLQVRDFRTGRGVVRWTDRRTAVPRRRQSRRGKNHPRDAVPDGRGTLGRALPVCDPVRNGPRTARRSGFP